MEKIVDEKTLEFINVFSTNVVDIKRHFVMGEQAPEFEINSELYSYIEKTTKFEEFNKMVNISKVDFGNETVFQIKTIGEDGQVFVYNN